MADCILQGWLQLFPNLLHPCHLPTKRWSQWKAADVTLGTPKSQWTSTCSLEHCAWSPVGNLAAWGCHAVRKPRHTERSCVGSPDLKSSQPRCRRLKEQSFRRLHTPDIKTPFPSAFKSFPLKQETSWSRNKTVMLCLFQIPDLQNLLWTQ